MIHVVIFVADVILILFLKQRSLESIARINLFQFGAFSQKGNCQQCRPRYNAAEYDI